MQWGHQHLHSAWALPSTSMPALLSPPCPLPHIQVSFSPSVEWEAGHIDVQAHTAWHTDSQLGRVLQKWTTIR